VKFIIFFLFSLNIISHGVVKSIDEYDDSDRKINFPDTDKYFVISSDLHTHSVFSDGHVWPNLRVAEALKDGIDLIAITEHLELQPHINDIPHPDRNRSYDIAHSSAKNTDLLVINGSEISRKFPPGHINAVFIDDANKLIKIDRSKQPDADRLLKSIPQKLIKDYLNEPWLNDAALAGLWPIEETLREAKKQNAFTFWNHPVWSAEQENVDEVLTPMHRSLFKKNLINGIEVVNGIWFSDKAFQIAIDYGLTIIGTSDVHGLIDWDYLQKPDGHRPVTLILSKNRTEASIKEALFDGRTVVWYKNELIGLEKNVKHLIQSYLKINKTSFKGDTSVLLVEILNKSDVKFVLRVNDGKSIENNSNIFSILPNGITKIEIGNSSSRKLNLGVDVLNAFIEPNKHPSLIISND
tara:strand:- start:3593 stop:4822 length:1230 start_codon:yes stop_codon:yes gene_type:complete